jgi:hypothetical protein
MPCVAKIEQQSQEKDDAKLNNPETSPETGTYRARKLRTTRYRERLLPLCTEAYADFDKSHCH